MRTLWYAALIAGASYCLKAWFGIDGAWTVIWKGAGVALLAAWAASERANWIAAVLALGALGDVLLDIAGLTVGAMAFLAGHIVAAIFYWRNRRELLAPTIPLLLLIATPIAAFLLPDQRGSAPGIALYATSLGAMAATAWASRFPRNQVALGALLFLASDRLIFARLGPLGGSILPRALIWPLYFAGQAMIAWGVVTTMRLSRS